MSSGAAFLLQFVLNYIVFGAITTAFLFRHRDRWGLPSTPLALLGFGLAPYLVTLVLYYALLLAPGIPVIVACSAVIVFFLLLAISAGSGWGASFGHYRGLLSLFKDPSTWPLLAGFAFVTAIGWIVLVNKPLVDHDVLEYAVQGRIFLREMAIHYVPHRIDPATGFYYVGLHGFSFPLFFTWEGMLNGIFGTTGDAWSRSITLWYGALLIALMASVARMFDRWLAVVITIASTSALGFVFLLPVYHLDSYRIFLFSCALGLFVHAMMRPQRANILLFAFLCGAQAWVHSVGAILAGVLWALMFLLLPVEWSRRLRWSVLAVGTMLIAGAIHYPLDVFFGTGWLFKDIIWF